MQKHIFLMLNWRENNSFADKTTNPKMHKEQHRSNLSISFDPHQTTRTQSSSGFYREM